MARSLRGDSVRDARAPDVEPWILPAAPRHSRRIPHELRADGPVRGNVRAALRAVERPGRTSRETIWRESGARRGTRDRSRRLGGPEHSAQFYRGVRRARGVAVRIPLLFCMRDGGCRVDVSARGARRLHGNSRRNFSSCVRHRRALGRSDRPRLRMEKWNPGLCRSGARGRPGIRYLLSEPARRASISCPARRPGLGIIQRVPKAIGVGARRALGPGRNGKPERELLCPVRGSGLVPSRSRWARRT